MFAETIDTMLASIATISIIFTFVLFPLRLAGEYISEKFQGVLLTIHILVYTIAIAAIMMVAGMHFERFLARMET